MTASMKYTTRLVTKSDAVAASKLVQDSFNKFVAPDWDTRGVSMFLSDTSSAAMAMKLDNCTYAAGTFVDEQMVGFILMTKAAFVQMLFIAPEWLRQGIGRGLWDHTRSFIETHHTEIRTIELNASPHSVPFYRSVGFASLSCQYVADGCRTTRMGCWLPARRLGAEIRDEENNNVCPYR